MSQNTEHRVTYRLGQNLPSASGVTIMKPSEKQAGRQVCLVRKYQRITIQ